MRTATCYPVVHPEVVEAEPRFLASARAISGGDVDFLVKHATLGLPDRAAVDEALRSPGWHVMSTDNSPLVSGSSITYRPRLRL